MPKTQKAWSSWNSSSKKNEIEKNSITYWINLLCEKNLIVLSNFSNSERSIKSENTLYLKKCIFGLNLL